jgi:hypothetical protein
MGKITYYIKKKIGREVHSFSVEGDNLFDAVLTSRNLSFNNVEKCGKCGHDDLDLGAHAAKGRFKYVTIKCKSCKAYLNFGQQQENPDIFYLRTRQEGDRKVLDWQDANTPMDEQ